MKILKAEGKAMSRINGYAPSDVAALNAGSVKKDAGKVPVTGSDQNTLLRATGDETKLSTASTAVAQASAGSDVRTDKVAALKLAIAAGSYHVSAGDVADKLIDNLLGGQ